MAAPVITELNVESAPKAILKEWLTTWFDGGSHTVGGNPAVIFPKVVITFDQGEVLQPFETQVKPAQNVAKIQGEIRIVCIPRGEKSHANQNPVDGNGFQVTEYVSFHFYVRTSKPGAGQPQFLASQISDLLKGLLGNPDTRYPIAAKGISHLQPQKPQSLTSSDFSERLIVCVAELKYLIKKS